MDILLLAVLLAIGYFVLKSRDERRHIVLLATHLQALQIEKLMEQLIQGYMRALDAGDTARREQIWTQLEPAERQLADQFNRLAVSIANEDAAATRVSKLALPMADQWWPRHTFDLRQALAIHARGLAAVVENAPGRSLKDKAYTVLAEVLLMQHTCHWFCKSKTVASARLLARHKTAYVQVLQSVSSATRQAYLALTGQSLPK
ncbi:MAG TPA: hypothetical protein VFY31_04575 [Macromonas sp.]|nr:hypothetical protein [Macromonas sp.]